MRKENVVDVDVMGPNMMKKIGVEDYYEDVVDDDEEIQVEHDENNDWILELNDFHCSNYYSNWNYLVTVHDDLAYLMKSDILSPLYLCLSTQYVWRSLISGQTMNIIIILNLHLLLLLVRCPRDEEEEQQKNDDVCTGTSP